MRKQVVHKALIESTALIGASILQTKLLGHMLFYILTTSAETLDGSTWENKLNDTNVHDSLLKGTWLLIDSKKSSFQVGRMAAVIRNLLELQYLDGDYIT
ncbi:hypothetical protein Tco_1047504, partial [Tanacetum coccineum]